MQLSKITYLKKKNCDASKIFSHVFENTIIEFANIFFINGHTYVDITEFVQERGKRDCFLNIENVWW